MVPIGGGSSKSVLSDRWIVYTKSRKQLLHRKYLLYETDCRTFTYLLPLLPLLCIHINIIHIYLICNIACTYVHDIISFSPPKKLTDFVVNFRKNAVFLFKAKHGDISMFRHSLEPSPIKGFLFQNSRLVSKVL